MSKVSLVLRHELITTITRRSFLFGAIGIPLIAFLIFMGVGALNTSAPDLLSGLVGSKEKPGGEAEGFVDLAGLIEVIPEDLEHTRTRHWLSRLWRPAQSRPITWFLWTMSRRAS